jgi:RNA polymerase sigma-70 factor (ECF subfamily)
LPIFKTHPELLRAFRAGNHKALETVYRFYVQRVDRYVRSLARSTGTTTLGHPSAVADLLQDVFIRAFSDRGRNAYDGLRDYGPYLTTIARNSFIDLQRALGREILTSPDELTDVPDEAAAESESLVDAKIAAVLTSYVESLVAPQRGVYEQRFVLGLSQEQASATLGLSRRAVRTGEKRLRVGLRKALSRAGISLRELDQIMENSPTKNARSPVLVSGTP